MNDTFQVPWEIKVIAYLFIFFGIGAGLEMVLALAQGNINLNFGVLQCFVGLGLLRLSDRWRVGGLVFIWIGLIGLPLLGVLFLQRNPVVSFFGRPLGTIPGILLLLVVIVLFGLAFWEYRVLTRPDIRDVFC